MEIAKTILEQLGGNRFIAMTGAKHFVGSKDALSFRLPGGGGFTRQGINAVRITLNGLDLYDLEFMRVRGVKTVQVAGLECVHVEDLRKMFEHYTGLRVSL